MRGPKPKYRIELTPEEEQALRRLKRARNSPQGKVMRARILLYAFDHPEWSNQRIAQEAGCTDWTVRKWRKRWVERRSIEDLPRPGAPGVFPLKCGPKPPPWPAVDLDRKAFRWFVGVRLRLLSV